MQLLASLSHMPFKHGEELLFCHSEGLAVFVVPSSGFASSLGVAAQTTEFQPWQLARLRNGVVELFEVSGVTADAPGKVFCNPVSYGATLSFILGRNLWVAPYNGNLQLEPTLVRRNVFSGFVQGGRTVYVTPSCVSNSSQVAIESPEGVSLVDFNFDTIVRVIPDGLTNLIVTGKTGGVFRSVLWTPESTFQILTNGQEVYKCCIDGDTVIHAKRETDFEERFLHVEPLTLTPYA